MTHDQKIWFITGCSTGFGRALAEEVLAVGDRAVVTARNADQVKDIVAAHGDNGIALALDVTDPAQVRAAVTAAEDTFGGIDVLFNNAGIGYFAAVEESTDEEIRRIFEINVFGLSDVIRAALPGMRKRRSGTIVKFSSIGGLRAFPAVGPAQRLRNTRLPISPESGAESWSRRYPARQLRRSDSPPTALSHSCD
ncbi:SDR family NAD(P)-dependent oxidoreductase [Streptomyces sp. 6N106]|uniref:SDR family NAD(P)-dependent oxidoreductase n=1 Tax=Streptomyces sp. 6N106 TaxID=3457418 RepID=UPI003FD1FD0C